MPREKATMKPFVFPRWANNTIPFVGIVLGALPLFLISLVWYGAAPATQDVGYAPEQPVPYSHKLHAGDLGIDCRYCHNTVDKAAQAAIPPTETCMNCHTRIKTKSEKLQPVRDSFEKGTPIAWVKVHDLPDYVYFNHSAHVTRGIGCVSCHGRVDQMEIVTQVEELSMGWCLDCHRNPEPHLRPPAEVTNMNWQQTSPDFGETFRAAHNLNPSTDCSTCHR